MHTNAVRRRFSSFSRQRKWSVTSVTLDGKSEGDILPVSNFMEVLRCCCCFLLKRDYLYSPLAVLDFRALRYGLDGFDDQKKTTARAIETSLSVNA